MSRYFIVFLFLLIPFCSRSQTGDELYAKFMNEFSAQNFPAAIETGKIYLNKTVVKDTTYLKLLRYLSFCYYSTGDYPSAIEKYNETRSLTELLLGKENYDYIMCTYNLAINYSYTGAYSRSFELLNEVLDFIVKDQTKDCPDYVNTATQMANIYTIAGCIEKAEAVYEDVLAVMKANYEETDTAYMQFQNTLATFYLQNGRYDKAEPFYVNAVKQMETAYGKLSQNYIMTLNSLGEFYLYAGKYPEMEKVFLEFVDLCGQFFGKVSADYATALNNLAVAYEKQGKNKEAEDLYIQCLKIKEKVFKKESNFYALTLSNFAVLYDNMGKYKEAEKLLDEAIDIYKTVYGEDNDNYHVALSNMASVYSSSGKYDKAIELLIKAAELQKKKYGEKYNAYINTLNSLATLYEEAGKYDLSDSLFTKTAELRKEVLGPAHTDYATTLVGLAHLKTIKGEYGEAEKLLNQALGIQRKAVGEDDASFANCLNSLAGLYSYMGNYSRSGELYEQCRLRYIKIYGDVHPEYATFLNNYGMYFYESGDYNKAEEILKRSLEIDEYALGKDNPANMNMLANLTNVMLHKGNYKEAEEYSTEAVRIAREKLGENHPNYVSAIIGLGVFYYETGNYDKAEKCYLEALEKYKTLLGENNSEYVTVENNLGALYMARCIQSDDDNQATAWALSAEKYFLLALKADSITKGTKHPDFSLHLGNLAEFYRNTGQFEKSEKLYKESIENEIRVFGEDYPALAVSYHNIGLLYSSAGQFAKAEEYCKKSLALKQKTYGGDNPVCSDVMASLAYVYENTGEYTEADDLYKRALSMNYELLRNNFSFLSEEEKANYLSTISHYNHMYASFVMSRDDKISDAAGTLLNNMLINKGILLRSSGGMRNEILNGKDKALIAKYNEWLGYRQELAKLYSTPEKERFRSVSEIEEKANVLEKELVAATAGKYNSKEIFSRNWKEVQGALCQNEASVEFGHFRRLEADNNYSDNYFAVVVRPGYPQPVAVKLFESKEIEKMTGKYSGSSLKYVTALYSSSELYDFVWSPLDSLLAGVQTVYCSPDGMLHKISFAALKDSGDKYLSAKYDINMMASTYLIKENKGGQGLAAKADASIFGGAIYSVGEEPQGGWKYLDGTLTEAENIRKILAGVSMPVKEYSGKEASEENIKGLDGKNATTIIHIATHGFFYPSETESKEEVVNEAPLMADLSFRGGASAILNFLNSPNPLMRSGLALAGANNVWSATPISGEDGILTAYEVSNLNLSKTQLIVLSACETGLGDIKGSEGVYGLQRAFKIAGAKYIIMSLWQVPDKETTEFMETFYTKLLGLKNIRKAFLETQSVMRKKYDPYYWAAFVLVE